MEPLKAGFILTFIELFGDVAAKKQNLIVCLTSYIALGLTLFNFFKDSATKFSEFELGRLE